MTQLKHFSRRIDGMDILKDIWHENHRGNRFFAKMLSICSVSWPESFCKIPIKIILVLHACYLPKCEYNCKLTENISLKSFTL